MNSRISYIPIIDTVREKGKQLSELLETTSLDLQKNLNNKVFLIGGGDGFMLDQIKKTSLKEGKFVSGNEYFWVNCGTLGFLLNDIPFEQIPQDEREVVKYKITPLQVTIHADGKQQTVYAINDIVIGNTVFDYFSFDIEGRTFSQQLKGTGLLVSSALGSSAYRLNNGGPLMPRNANLVGIMGIASLPFDYKILPNQSINIKVAGRKKPEIWIDGAIIETKNIDEINIAPSQEHFSLLFHKELDFDTKRILLAEQKLHK